MMFWWGKKEGSPRDRKVLDPGQQTCAVPAVKFNPARVTETVKTDLKENVKCLSEISPGEIGMIYDAALRSISAGGALDVIHGALLSIEGMTKGRAKAISISLWSKAYSIMQAEEQSRVGIKYATWLYSGAPCGGMEQDAAHKAINGKPYRVNKGMFLNGHWTWPGYPEGCKCSSKPMVVGFDGYTGGKPEGLLE